MSTDIKYFIGFNNRCNVLSVIMLCHFVPRNAWECLLKTCYPLFNFGPTRLCRALSPKLCFLGRRNLLFILVLVFVPFLIILVVFVLVVRCLACFVVDEIVEVEGAVGI